MSNFRCVAIPTEIGERWRASGVDDSGNRLRRVVAESDVGYPCRHCLRNAKAGEEVLLGSYRLPRPRGIYWTPSPIFVHAGPCERFDRPDEIPPVLRAALVSIRAYDHDDQCLYDLGRVAEGHDVDRPLLDALDDPRTAFVSIHTARPGCMLCQAQRA